MFPVEGNANVPLEVIENKNGFFLFHPSPRTSGVLTRVKLPCPVPQWWWLQAHAEAALRPCVQTSTWPWQFQ